MPEPTSITVYATQNPGVGETVHIWGMLIGRNLGEPVTNVPIVISATGLTPFPVMTDRWEGGYRTSVVFNTPGEKTVTATFQGNERYEGCS